MMGAYAEIEHDASPEEVRRIFLDFEHWPDIKNETIRSVVRVPQTKTGSVEKGEKLDVDFGSFQIQVAVLENAPNKFKWRGDIMYVLVEEHTYGFEPSKITPGGTTFTNREEFFRLNAILMYFVTVQDKFEQFNRDFKARVESVLKKERGSA